MVAPGKADRLNSWAKHAHSPRIYAKVSTFPHPTDEVGEQADRFNQFLLFTYCSEFVLYCTSYVTGVPVESV